MNALTVLDLFCGCGGMSRGLVDAGLDVIAGIDVWDKALDSYRANFAHVGICADLKELSPEMFEEKYGIGEVDVIVGGPPCQGMSVAGKRDTKDPRNSLFMEYVKYINYYSPRAFMMENVIGILSMKTEEGVLIIDIIMSCFAEKYNCCIAKLYASDFEVPQNRRRVIIIGVRKDLGIVPIEPLAVSSNRLPVSGVLLDRADVDKSAFLSAKAIAGINAKKERSKAEGKGFGAQFLDMNKPSYTIPARYWKDGYDALVKYSDTDIRRLTVLELKRIQTFPDDYVLTGAKKDMIIQIGNAVACRFAYHLGRYLMGMLGGLPNVFV